MTLRVTGPQAAVIFKVKVRTIYAWARKHGITRHADGYELADLLKAEAARDVDALAVRAGIKGAAMRSPDPCGGNLPGGAGCRCDPPF